MPATSRTLTDLCRSRFKLEVIDSANGVSIGFLSETFGANGKYTVVGEKDALVLKADLEGGSASSPVSIFAVVRTRPNRPRRHI